MTGHGASLGLEDTVVDADCRRAVIEHLQRTGVVLPTFAELAEPHTIAPRVQSALESVDPASPHPLNLFRVHWHNSLRQRRFVDVPEHLVLDEAFTGVRAPIIVVLGNRFPLIAAHKVLAAYGCLAPRLVTGRFDPRRHRAVWPSTGNYARGGIAISRLLGCRGVAVLPEGMSRERFEWLERWVGGPGDIVRTPGSESNVKEIYDECHRLAADPDCFVLNQFCEFGNYLAHFAVTGPALEAAFEVHRRVAPRARLAAFVAASGSSGTLAAGDQLRERHDARIVGAEALECPTMLYNGFGEHNIQGIGDKHIPLIHNVMAMDAVTAVSDRATDELSVFLASDDGRRLLRSRGVADETLAGLDAFGLSSICNVIASIKTAKHFDLGPDDAVVTVATDGAALYESERARILEQRFAGELDARKAAATYARHISGASTDHYLELTEVERRRIFNLGYFTWVEQQDIPLEVFEARRSPQFWRVLRPYLARWDDMIRAVNDEAGVDPSPSPRPAD